jgi:hypothetical protein
MKICAKQIVRDMVKQGTKRKEEQCCQVNILGIVAGLVFWASEGGHAAEAIS